MSRNAEAHGAFYGARNHAPPEGTHPLMSHLETPANPKPDDARSGGWTGRGYPATPFTKLGTKIDNAKHPMANPPGTESTVPVFPKAPPKRFQP